MAAAVVVVAVVVVALVAAVVVVTTTATGLGRGGCAPGCGFVTGRGFATAHSGEVCDHATTLCH